VPFDLEVHLLAVYKLWYSREVSSSVQFLIHASSSICICFVWRICITPGAFLMCTASVSEHVLAELFWKARDLPKGFLAHLCYTDRLKLMIHFTYSHCVHCPACTTLWSTHTCNHLYKHAFDLRTYIHAPPCTFRALTYVRRLKQRRRNCMRRNVNVLLRGRVGERKEKKRRKTKMGWHFLSHAHTHKHVCVCARTRTNTYPQTKTHRGWRESCSACIFRDLTHVSCFTS